VIVKQTFEHYFKKSDVKLIRSHNLWNRCQCNFGSQSLKVRTPSRFKIVGFVDIAKISQKEFGFTDIGAKEKLPTLMRSVGAEGFIMIKVCQKKNA
jgi:hypothetical protein